MPTEADTCRQFVVPRLVAAGWDNTPHAIAVFEAKAEHNTAGDGFQQAKDYSHPLRRKFAYATNGKGIIEVDFFTGRETPRLSALLDHASQD